MFLRNSTGCCLPMIGIPGKNEERPFFNSVQGWLVEEKEEECIKVNKSGLGF